MANWFAQFFKNNLNDPSLSQLGNTGTSEFGAGTDTTNQGLSNLDSLASGDQAQIADGGLTKALQNQYSVAHGSVADQLTRSIRSNSASTEQARLQADGSLSPEAALELKMQGDNASNTNAYDANNQLSMSEAQQGLSATQALQNQILDIRKTQTGVGESEQGLGASLLTSAAGLKLQRRKDVADTAVKIMGMFKGGF